MNDAWDPLTEIPLSPLMTRKRRAPQAKADPRAACPHQCSPDADVCSCRDMAKQRAKPRKLEDGLHKSIYRALLLCTDPAKVLVVSHESRMAGRNEGRARKARGVRAGWPDMQVVWAPGKMALIELKYGKGRMSEDQVAMHATLNALGVPVATCNSLDAVLAFLRAQDCPLRIREDA